MKIDYQIGPGPASRAVEYTDQRDTVLFTFDMDESTILLEPDLEGDEDRYVFAARVARDYLSKKFRSYVDFWPVGLLAERCKSVEPR